MQDHHDSLLGSLLKALLWVGAWFGTIKLADVQLVVSILSGLMVGGLAAANLWVTWRDKIRRRR